MAHIEPDDLRVIFGRMDEETHYVVTEPEDMQTFLAAAREFWTDVTMYRLVPDEE